MNGGEACLPCSLVTDLRKYKSMIIIIFASGFYLRDFFLQDAVYRRSTTVVPPSVRMHLFHFFWLLTSENT